jgi:acetoin utilization deacetylase AcuC-like enzyme
MPERKLYIAWNDLYAHPLPEGHRFPMLKYELIPQQLLHEGTIASHQLFSPSFLTEKNILRVHQKDYWEKLKNLSLNAQEIRMTGFPLSEQLVQRELSIMQGTLDCALFALENGFAFNVAGGTHHAFSERGEGFCLLNDMAIATQYLIEECGLKRILIVDLDVHQGNGTAAIFHGRHDVFTFSMHGEHNYPLQKEKSTLDVPLPDGCSDELYLHLLQQHLPVILDAFQPQFIFYQCGVDVLASDKLGRMNLSLDACKKRDIAVLEAAHQRRVPLVAALGGGYSEDIRIIVEAHCTTFRIAQDLVG